MATRKTTGKISVWTGPRDASISWNEGEFPNALARIVNGKLVEFYVAIDGNHRFHAPPEVLAKLEQIP